MAQAWVVPSTLEMIVGEKLNITIDFTNLIAAGDKIWVNYPGQVLLTPNLVGYWRLSETSGTTAVDVTGNHNGTISASGVTLGAVGAIISDADTAMAFNGSTGSVTITSAAFDPSGTKPFTIAAWVNPSSIDTNFRRICGREGTVNHGAFLMWQSAAGWGFLRGDSGAGNDTVFGGTPSSGYSFIVGTYDGVNMRLYVNGSLVGTQASSRSVDVGTSSLLIGGTNASLNGAATIDEVSVFNTALTGTQITNLYSAGTVTNFVPAAVIKTQYNESVPTAIVGGITSSGNILNITISSSSLRSKTSYVMVASCTAAGGGTTKNVSGQMAIKIIY